MHQLSEQPNATPTREGPLWTLGYAAALSIVAFAIYSPSLRCDFVNLDDPQYVTNNPFIRFPTWHKLGVFFREWKNPSMVAGYYQPLTMASLMLDSVVDNHAPPRPFIYHLTNVLLHALNVALAFVWLRQLLANGWHGVFARWWLPAGMALIFGLHPVNVEAVTWVCQRKALLSTTFVLASLLAYGWYVRRGGVGRYLVVAACFVLSLLSKPTGWLLPAILLILDIWPLRRFSLKAVVEKLPLAVIAVVGGYVAYISQYISMGRAGVVLWEKPLLSFLIISHNMGFYLGKLVWPALLSPQYPLPPDNLVRLGNPPFAIGVLVTAAVAVVLVVALRRRAWAVLAGLGGFLLLLGPVMGPLDFMGAIAADRFLYLPMIMLLPMVLAGANRWSGKSRGRASVIALGMGAGLVALSTKTFAQQDVWKDSIAYWTQCLRYDPREPGLLDGMANAYLERYDRYQQEPDGRDHASELDQAQRWLAQVIRERPTYSRAYFGLSQILILRKMPAEALAVAERGLSLPGIELEGWLCKGRALSRLDRYAESVEWYERYLARKPFDPEAWHMLGQAYSATGRPDRAEQCFAKAIECDPEFERGEPHYGLGQTRVMQHRDADAIAPFVEAVKRQPGNAQYRLALAACLASAGRDGDAMRELALAIHLRPDLYGVAEKQTRFTRLRGTLYWERLQALASQPTSAPSSRP